jgi:hypothetical protein
VRIVGWWLLVALGMLAALYATTLVLTWAFLVFRERTPYLFLGGIALLPIAAIALAIVERWQTRGERALKKLARQRRRDES